MLTLPCSENNEVMNLLRANYGRFSITICNEHGDTDWSGQLHVASLHSRPPLPLKVIPTFFFSFLQTDIKI
jgi:hypothetical protein